MLYIVFAIEIAFCKAILFIFSEGIIFKNCWVEILPTNSSFANGHPPFPFMATSKCLQPALWAVFIFLV
ncbi:MAG: hypothetical protein RLZZ414_630 [Bacteroidota bacterium]